MGKGKGRGRGRGRGRGKKETPPTTTPQPGQQAQDASGTSQDEEFPSVQPAFVGRGRGAQRPAAQPVEEQFKTMSLSAKEPTPVRTKEMPVLSVLGKQPSAGIVAQQSAPATVAQPPIIPAQSPITPVQQMSVRPKDVQPTLNQLKRTNSFNEGKRSSNGSYSVSSSAQNGNGRKEYPIPKRPDHGQVGRVIKLRANLFQLKIPDMDIHHYDVTINDGKNDDKTPKVLNRKILEELAAGNKKIFSQRPVFDGKKNLYTKNPFTFNGVKSFDLEFMEDGVKRNFKVSLKWVNQVNMYSLSESLKGKGSIPQDAIQGLDMVLRQAATLSYTPVGSRFFTSSGAVNIGMGLEVWHGYHQSIRPTQWKMMVNIDVSASAFYRTIDVIEYLYEITCYDCTKIRQELNDAERKQFQKEIKGLKVEITYMGKQKRKYRVNGLTKMSTSRQTFSIDVGGKEVQVTVESYFKKERGISLRYPWLPCLHVGDVKKTVYIPMEVCRLIPGQRCLKKLGDTQTAEMIKQTAKKPAERFATITRHLKEADFDNDPFVKSFGVKVNSQMVQLEGRVLQTPGILYKDRNRPLIPSNGSWNMKGITLYSGAEIRKWGLVVYNFGRGMQENAILKFQSELIKIANGMGIKIGQPAYQRIATEKDAPDQIVTEALRKDKEMDLLVVILPGKTPYYGDLKRLGDTENGYSGVKDEITKNILKQRGLITQCIQSKNAMQCKPMTLAQLCLKINAKMGGINNSINSHSLTRPSRVFNEPVLFLGADVTHPGIGDKSSPSIAAVVGSVDPHPIRYAVSVRVQTHREEVIKDLANITKELLLEFYRAIKKKPQKIIMFRDGVSEGQFQQVLFHEMTAIRKACTLLEKGYEPAITFIVVQKRHHTRFTVQNPGDADRSGNCPAGTTIDTVVCHPTEFDYYQYSHAGIQGTSRPTHYHVLWDDNDFRADELQALSFMLCHLYVRCTRSVSIPAPAYYAHHVAFRARYHLQKEEGSESSGSSESSGNQESAVMLNLKEIVKPHPKLLNRMYFV